MMAVRTVAASSFLIGGYPVKGAEPGIMLVRDENAILTDRGVVVVTESPSFLVSSVDGSLVYAVNETDPGRVSAFRRSGTLAEPGLQALGDQPTGGAHPCHLALHPSARLLAVANYSSGSVTILPLAEDGSLRPRSQLLQLHGSGPNPDRQEGPHAHQVTFTAGGSELVVADLGSDRLWRYRYRANAFEPMEPLSLPAGSGTRQLLLELDAGLAAGRGYVLGELDNSISTLAWDPPRVLSSVPGHLEPLAPGTLSAALLFGPRPGLLYASHRGADCITLLRQDGDRVTPVTDFSAAGRQPRHVLLFEQQLYIANQGSNTLAAVPVDSQTGMPAGPARSVPIPSPSCVLPW
jgi:6-phosphogluconolactonase